MKSKLRKAQLATIKKDSTRLRHYYLNRQRPKEAFQGTQAEYVCQKKMRFSSYRTALINAKDAFERSGLVLYPYKCGRCGDYHLTHNETFI